MARSGDDAADAVGDSNTCELAEASAADARSMFSAISNDSAAADGDGTAGACSVVITAAAADACTVCASRRRDGSAADGDVATDALASAADARRSLASRSRDGAALNDDVTACPVVAIKAAASDARAVFAARGRHAAATLDGERCAAAARQDGRTFLGRARDGIRTVEDDGGVAAALDAGAGGDVDGGPTEREGITAADSDGAADGDATG